MRTWCRYLRSNNLAIFLVFLCVISFFIFICAPASAAILTVTNTDDSGAGSLREAVIFDSVSGDVITFDETVTGTITLSRQLTINKNITIQGPGPEILSLSGYGAERIFYVGPGCSVTISGLSIVDGNAGSNLGGGIYNVSDNLTVSNCIFMGNMAESAGGIYNYGCSPRIINCTFSVNRVSSYGGGVYNRNCPAPVIENCTFDFNYAPYYGGGGICNYSSSPKVTNCTFISNTANNGGGIYNYLSSNPTVINCTFKDNNAISGSGMRNEISSCPMVTNCIFWDGGSGEIVNLDINSSIPVISYCVVKNGTVTGNPIISGEYFTTDPMLGEPAYNGGPTQTCALGEGSSAIDSGITIAKVSIDQRGIGRPKGSGYDIGAYEVVNRYTVNAYHNTGGVVSPESADVWEGESMDFTFLPDPGYEVWEVYVDGDPVSYDEVNLSYTFENLSSDHVISVDFQPGDNGSGGGCNISVLPYVGLLLLLPLMFLPGKIK